ncbi:tyrosine-type recombinase/integrase [Herbaspirillum frisingense]|uniref:tyrosine-type recombinase/integrase n=1 Tax=Herbaspirillum frisingense TaxID=92645 RepID=UPI0015FEBF17|nr:site-specific integrase [Herbaspirillum frisingense]QNB08395.1 tyrosine-type recombinase/integrase [Herbaspirillum frisingense]
MRTRTKGISVDAGGERKVDKQYKGQRIFARLGTVSQEDAEAWLRAEQAAIDRQQAQRPQHYFLDAADRYLDEKEKEGEKQYDYANAHLAKILPYIGTKLIETIHSGSFDKFKADRMTPAGGIKGVTPATVNKTLEVVRAILIRAARVWRNEDGTPWLVSAPLIEMLEHKNPRRAYPITWEEQSMLFNELPPHLERMALFAVNAGTRDENTCGLRWDWEQRFPELGRSVFVIPAGEYKSGRHHVVILNDTAQAVVDGQRGKHSTFVFPYRGERIQEMGNNGWKQARERAKLSQVRVHDLRHTYATRLRNAGVSEEDRALLLGHSIKSMPQHYAAGTVEHLVEQANKVELTRKRMTILRVVNG